ncbi:hypothetical protein ACWA2C_28165 [Priestia megaterium]
MAKRLFDRLFEGSGALMGLLAMIGIVFLIYTGDWGPLKEVLKVFQPYLYYSSLIGMLSIPMLAFRQYWTAAICNFALCAGMLYFAGIVIESWR